MKVEPLPECTCGATVTGVSVDDLDDDMWTQIESAFHQYGFLVFPGQFLSIDAQTRFAKRFGNIELLSGNPKHESIMMSNQKSDGSLLKDHEHAMRVMVGNEGWHTDSTYMPLSSKCGMLSAVQVPSCGGSTEFADMQAAYEALDTETKYQIANLCALHSAHYSSARNGFFPKIGAGYGYNGDAFLRPLVKQHPVTGRSSLFIGRHAFGIPGMSPVASRHLLDLLVSNACQPPRVYEHRWRPGDLLVWDNRCMLHRARPYSHDEPRVLVATRVAGDPSTEAALPCPNSKSILASELQQLRSAL